MHGYEEHTSPEQRLRAGAPALLPYGTAAPASAGSRRGHEESSLTWKHMKHGRVKPCLICSRCKLRKTRSAGICNPEHHLAQLKILK